MSDYFDDDTELKIPAVERAKGMVNRILAGKKKVEDNIGITAANEWVDKKTAEQDQEILQDAIQRGATPDQAAKALAEHKEMMDLASQAAGMTGGIKDISKIPQAMLRMFKNQAAYKPITKIRPNIPQSIKDAARVDLEKLSGKKMYSDDLAQTKLPIDYEGAVANTALRKADEGGFSLKPSGKQPSEGHMVSLPKENELIIPSTVDKFNKKQAVREYLRKVQKDPELYAGGWSDKGKLVLDKSQNILDRSKAEALGKSRNQDAIYDVVNQNVIPLKEEIKIPSWRDNPNIHSSLKDVTEDVPIEWLEKFKGNKLRKTPDQMEALKTDIQQNGFKEPLIMSFGTDDGLAVLGEGNHRLQVAKELGLKTVPVRALRRTEVGSENAVPTSMSAVKPGKYFPGDAKPSDVFDELKTPKR
jgi:hypothetical protein